MKKKIEKFNNRTELLFENNIQIAGLDATNKAHRQLLKRLLKEDKILEKNTSEREQILKQAFKDLNIKYNHCKVRDTQPLDQRYSDLLLKLKNKGINFINHPGELYKDKLVSILESIDNIKVKTDTKTPLGHFKMLDAILRGHIRNADIKYTDVPFTITKSFVKELSPYVFSWNLAYLDELFLSKEILLKILKDQYGVVFKQLKEELNVYDIKDIYLAFKATEIKITGNLVDKVKIYYRVMRALPFDMQNKYMLDLSDGDVKLKVGTYTPKDLTNYTVRTMLRLLEDIFSVKIDKDTQVISVKDIRSLLEILQKFNIDFKDKDTKTTLALLKVINWENKPMIDIKPKKYILTDIKDGKTILSIV